MPRATWLRFLALSLISCAFLAVGAPTIEAQTDAGAPAAGVAPGGFAFFMIGDPQINIPKWGTAGTEATIEAMNSAPGEPFPMGGVIGEPRGVLVAGDLVDDLQNPDNWRLYEELFDVRGEARLRFPVYEGIGNHDLDPSVPPGELSVVERRVVERSRRREGEFNFCPLGYHYSWDWDGVHFVNLNVFPGDEGRPVYDNPSTSSWNTPRASLAFLKRDLKERVGDSGAPVVLVWHYGLRGWGLEKWWTEEDLANLRQALGPYNILLIVHGHEHRYERYRWDEYDVMMAPAPQYDPNRAAGEEEGRPKGFVVARVAEGELQTAYRHPDGWQDAWRKPLAPSKADAKAHAPAAAAAD